MKILCIPFASSALSFTLTPSTLFSLTASLLLEVGTQESPALERTPSFHLNLFPLSLFLSPIPNVCSSQKLGFFLSLFPLQNLTTETKDVIFPKICPTFDIFFGWVSFYTFSFRFLAISPLRCYVSISYLYIYIY